MSDLIRSVWIWGATATLVVAWVPVVLIVRLFDRNPLRLRTARTFRRLGPLVAKVNPWRIRIAGRENLSPHGAHVVVANHQSLADIPLIAHLGLEAKWLAKAELFQIPVFGWMMQMAGDVAVERSDRRKAAQALLQCARLLKQRLSIVFFPEGTRSTNGSILPFNDGPFQLAIREGVPVLPLVVEGTGSALPRQTWKFGGIQDIYLHVLPAVPTEGWTSGRVAELRELVRGRMIEELETIRKRKSPASTELTGRRTGS
jgi:1-acyl-sn-glycerol-3-phosphate acyltransferase